MEGRMMAERKLRVLMVVDHAVGISGPHRNVVGSLNALAARDDVDLRLLTGRIDPEEPYASHCDVLLGFEPHNVRSLFRNLRLLSKAAKGRDVIYVPSGLKSFLYSIAAKRRRRKLVAGPNVTGIPFIMNPYNPGPFMTTQLSDAWIEMSEVRVAECVRGGTPRTHIHLIPHAIDTDAFNPIYRKSEIWDLEGLDRDTIKIIYTGHLDVEHKGIAQLIGAFRLLRELTPGTQIDLALIGKGEHALTDEQRTIPGIHILGPRYGHELVALLASADIFIGASRYETFWFAPLEAMACGIPVVVSNVGAVPSMIPENGTQGISVELIDNEQHYLPDAAERLARAVLPLIRDSGYRARIGEAARQHALRNFALPRLGDDLINVFRSVSSW
jgi:glycosyltransferase involved in cell wall biosynthesis